MLRHSLATELLRQGIADRGGGQAPHATARLLRRRGPMGTSAPPTCGPSWNGPGPAGRGGTVSGRAGGSTKPPRDAGLDGFTPPTGGRQESWEPGRPRQRDAELRRHLPAVAPPGGKEVGAAPLALDHAFNTVVGGVCRSSGSPRCCSCQPPVRAPWQVDRALVERYLAWLRPLPLAESTKAHTRCSCVRSWRRTSRHGWVEGDRRRCRPLPRRGGHSSRGRYPGSSPSPSWPSSSPTPTSPCSRRSLPAPVRRSSPRPVFAGRRRLHA